MRNAIANLLRNWAQRLLDSTEVFKTPEDIAVSMVCALMEEHPETWRVSNKHFFYNDKAGCRVFVMSHKAEITVDGVDFPIYDKKYKKRLRKVFIEKHKDTREWNAVEKLLANVKDMKAI